MKNTILSERDIRFDFGEAMEAVKFDEHCELTHCMKAVDFIAEYLDYYLFIEVKDPGGRGAYRSEKGREDLIDELTQKFRDSLIYRWCEGKIANKPVFYRCLVEVDSALALHINKKLRKALPCEGLPRGWKRRMAESCVAVNMAVWRKKFGDVVIDRVRPDLEV